MDDGRAVSVGGGSGEGVGLAVAVGDGVGSAVGVSVGTGVGGIVVGVALGVAVGVEVFVGLGVAVAVAVGWGMVVAAPMDVAGSAETGEGAVGVLFPQAARAMARTSQLTRLGPAIQPSDLFRFHGLIMPSSIELRSSQPSLTIPENLL